MEKDITVEIKLDITIKAKDVEDLGKALSQVYKEGEAILKAPRPITIPGYIPLPGTIKGTYPLEEKKDG